MLSGYFTPGSCDRKGTQTFIRDRLYRLGLPLLVYIAIVEPLLEYPLWVQKANFRGSLMEFFRQYIGSYSSLHVGALWFVEALLVFQILYALWRQIWKYIATPLEKPKHRGTPSPPGNTRIAILACMLGLLAFADRMLMSNNRLLSYMGLPIGHSTQYLALFVVGVLSYRYRWLAGLSKTHGRIWSIIVCVLTLLLPWILFRAGARAGNFSPYAAGWSWNWKALLAFAVWEGFMCVAFIVVLSVSFMRWFNSRSNLSKMIDRDTYAVYVVNAPVVTILVMGLAGISLDSGLKFLLVTPVAIVLCFIVGHVLKTLPYVRTIL